jgi:CDP-4-dehydro-6-deoxyglucose reductase
MSHTVVLEPSRRQFDVQEGETVLAAGLRQGFALPFGCQSGSCGSCRVRLSAGSVDSAEPDGTAPPALSEAEIDAGYILMCLARPCSDVTLQLHQPEMLEHLRPRQWPVRVARHRALSHDVAGLWVTLPRPGDGAEPFRFLPGQYVDFLLPDGRRRSFSIANDGADGLLEFHLRVTPGGFFAHYVQDEMPERAILRVEGPLGAFYVREDSARPALLMAGGTGFAPLKGMLERQFARGLSRPFHLFWGARSKRDLYLDALAREWAATQRNFRYTSVLSEPDADWQGERGFVHEAMLRAYPKLAGHEVYMAGPPVMVHAAKRAFVQAGLDADHLYYDSFDYAFETWPKLG